ncbi:MAG: prephenate dehydrogenase [Candidatus Schekmanbacteria bacterium]|nr:MAG: prephenate dehydrogenase [Candidatus Schekmanbacteria bacterium]
MDIDKIAIIGCGLIGGSIAHSIKKHHPQKKIIAFDIDKKTLDYVARENLADEAINIEKDKKIDLLRSCKIVVVATPVHLISDTISKILPHLSENSVVTDTGSAKSAIVKFVKKNCGSEAPFIGSHPIAGMEEKGIEYSDSAILEGKRVIITPLKESKKKSLLTIKNFWEKIGMKTVLMSPEEHDRLIAYTSHFPHLAVYLLMNTLEYRGAKNSNLWKCIGPGFKDFTRIAKSSPQLWTDIILLNKKEVLKVSSEFKKQMNKIEALIKSSEKKEIEEYFLKAQKRRKRIK